MTRRTAWTAGFLSITAAAVGAELWAALDSSPDTVPWTELIARYVPWPVTALAIAILGAWLPTHFQHAYGRHAMPLALDPNVKHPTEPLLTRATTVAAGTAVLAVAVAFGVHLSDAQQAAILGVLAVAGPLAAAAWARRHVYSPATVARLVDEARRRPPAGPASGPPA